MQLAHLLLKQAWRQGEVPAVFNGTTQRASYADWAARSAAAAQRLREAGLAPGDRVLLFMRNHPRYLELLWAAWWAGLVVTPVNAKLHPAEVSWIVDNAQARWGFVSTDVATSPLPGLERQVDIDSPAADQLLTPLPAGFDIPITEREPSDIAWLFYTSGTTGRPKGVMLTHRNLLTMGLGYFSSRWAVRSGRCLPSPRPPSCAGWSSTPRRRACRPRTLPSRSRPSSMAARPCTAPTFSARCV